MGAISSGGFERYAISAMEITECQEAVKKFKETRTATR